VGVSGQGSQAIGMGMDLLELSAAKDKFAQAEEILGWSVPEICQSQSDQISRTLYTQPSLYVCRKHSGLNPERGHQPDLLLVTAWENMSPSTSLSLDGRLVYACQASTDRWTAPLVA